MDARAASLALSLLGGLPDYLSTEMFAAQAAALVEACHNRAQGACGTPAFTILCNPTEDALLLQSGHIRKPLNLHCLVGKRIGGPFT